MTKLYSFLFFCPFFIHAQTNPTFPSYVCSGSTSNSSTAFVVGRILVSPAVLTGNRSAITDETLSKIVVFPNPVTDDLFFETGDKSAIKEIKICTVEGKIIYSGKVVNNTVNISFLKSGVYFVRFDKNAPNYKIIKK
ncbi:MAG: T9SS type A sorting domain-containing protein [Flavobacterium sp.]|nr:T9SS type A sorting domain-containing protein [Flavobacterium sp.]